MTRNRVFTFRLSQEEGELLKRISRALVRSQGDVLRIMIRQAADQIAADGNGNEPRSQDDDDKEGGND